MAAKKKSPAKKAPAKKSPAKKVSASRPKSQTDEPGKGRGIGAMRGSSRGGRGGSSTSYDKALEMANKYITKGEKYRAAGKTRRANRAFKKGYPYERFVKE